MCAVQATIECLHRKRYQVVATPRDSQIPTPSNRSEDQVHEESVHTDATHHHIDNTCNYTEHDSCRQYCTGYQSPRKSHYRMMPYFLKQISLKLQLTFLLCSRDIYSELNSFPMSPL